ncbi:MAG: SET domain-containing methyltransferase [Patescibacteria group bacterium]|jgi:SET domain-containing protein
MTIPDCIKIKKSPTGKGLFAKRTIKKGEIIFHFDGQITNGVHANAEALQIDEDKFLKSTAKYDDFLNHSCNPNCCIDWKALNLVALKNISENEEVTFNYNISEYDLLKGGNFTFKCRCGSKKCIKKIKGFKYLSREQKSEIQKFISPFLKNIFKQEV